MHDRPRLALTCGEPAGIGPDLCVMIGAALESLDTQCVVECLADESLLRDRATRLGIGFPSTPLFRVRHVPLAAPVTPGRLDVRNARWVLSLLDAALAGCRSGEYRAMVTAPVQKSVINDAGIPFTGHTEYLAERCDVKRPVMLLAAGSLRVALATTHLPLSAVSGAINGALLDETLDIIDHDLTAFWGIAMPRIGVTGLNPHAGEGRPPGPGGDRHHRASHRAGRGAPASAPPVPGPPTRSSPSDIWPNSMSCWRCTTTRDCPC